MRFPFSSTKRYAPTQASYATTALPPVFTPQQRALVDSYFHPGIGMPKESLLHKLALWFGAVSIS